MSLFSLLNTPTPKEVVRPPRRVPGVPRDRQRFGIPDERPGDLAEFDSASQSPEVQQLTEEFAELQTGDVDRSTAPASRIAKYKQERATLIAERKNTKATDQPTLRRIDARLNELSQLVRKDTIALKKLSADPLSGSTSPYRDVSILPGADIVAARREQEADVARQREREDVLIARGGREDVLATQRRREADVSGLTVTRAEQERLARLARQRVLDADVRGQTTTLAEQERLARLARQRETDEFGQTTTLSEQERLARLSRQREADVRGQTTTLAEQERLARLSRQREADVRGQTTTLSEQERLARLDRQQDLEAARVEEERLALEASQRGRETSRVEQERLARETSQRSRAEQERIAREATEQERLAREASLGSRTEQERLARETSQRSRVERERLASQRRRGATSVLDRAAEEALAGEEFADDFEVEGESQEAQQKEIDRLLLDIEDATSDLLREFNIKAARAPQRRRLSLLEYTDVLEKLSEDLEQQLDTKRQEEREAAAKAAERASEQDELTRLKERAAAVSAKEAASDVADQARVEAADKKRDAANRGIIDRFTGFFRRDPASALDEVLSEADEDDDREAIDDEEFDAQLEETFDDIDAKTKVRVFIPKEVTFIDFKLRGTTAKPREAPIATRSYIRTTFGADVENLFRVITAPKEIRKLYAKGEADAMAAEAADTIDVVLELAASRRGVMFLFEKLVAPVFREWSTSGAMTAKFTGLTAESLHMNYWIDNVVALLTAFATQFAILNNKNEQAEEADDDETYAENQQIRLAFELFRKMANFIVIKGLTGNEAGEIGSQAEGFTQENLPRARAIFDQLDVYGEDPTIAATLSDPVQMMTRNQLLRFDANPGGAKGEFGKLAKVAALDNKKTVGSGPTKMQLKGVVSAPLLKMAFVYEMDKDAIKTFNENGERLFDIFLDVTETDADGNPVGIDKPGQVKFRELTKDKAPFVDKKDIMPRDKRTQRSFESVISRIFCLPLLDALYFNSLAKLTKEGFPVDMFSFQNVGDGFPADYTQNLYLLPLFFTEVDINDEFFAGIDLVNTPKIQFGKGEKEVERGDFVVYALRYKEGTDEFNAARLKPAPSPVDLYAGIPDAATPEGRAARTVLLPALVQQIANLVDLYSDERVDSSIPLLSKEDRLIAAHEIVGTALFTPVRVLVDEEPASLFQRFGRRPFRFEDKKKIFFKSDARAATIVQSDLKIQRPRFTLPKMTKAILGEKKRDLEITIYKRFLEGREPLGEVLAEKLDNPNEKFRTVLVPTDAAVKAFLKSLRVKRIRDANERETYVLDTLLYHTLSGEWDFEKMLLQQSDDGTEVPTELSVQVGEREPPVFMNIVVLNFRTDVGGEILIDSDKAAPLARVKVSAARRAKNGIYYIVSAVANIDDAIARTNEIVDQYQPLPKDPREANVVVDTQRQTVDAAARMSKMPAYRLEYQVIEFAGDADSFARFARAFGFKKTRSSDKLKFAWHGAKNLHLTAANDPSTGRYADDSVLGDDYDLRTDLIDATFEAPDEATLKTVKRYIKENRLQATEAAPITRSETKSKGHSKKSEGHAHKSGGPAHKSKGYAHKSDGRSADASADYVARLRAMKPADIERSTARAENICAGLLVQSRTSAAAVNERDFAPWRDFLSRTGVLADVEEAARDAKTEPLHIFAPSATALKSANINLDTASHELAQAHVGVGRYPAQDNGPQIVAPVSPTDLHVILQGPNPVTFATLHPERQIKHMPIGSLHRPDEEASLYIEDVEFREPSTIHPVSGGAQRVHVHFLNRVLHKSAAGANSATVPSTGLSVADQWLSSTKLVANELAKSKDPSSYPKHLDQLNDQLTKIGGADAITRTVAPYQVHAHLKYLRNSVASNRHIDVMRKADAHRQIDEITDRFPAQ